MYEPDAGTQSMLDWVAAADTPSMIDMTPDQARAFQAAGTAKTNLDPEPVHAIENRTIEGPGGDLELRIYRPSDQTGLAICVYLHGGGFVIGSLDTHDPLCRRLANRSGAIIVSVNYRLAPEHRYPAGVEDASAALDWVAANAAALGGDAKRLAVSGDSAGGNLAAVAAHRAVDAGGPALRCQALIYPVTDHGRGDHETRRTMGEIFPIPTPVMEWFHEHYFGHAASVFEPDASPVRREDMRGLPQTLVLTAGLDPLCSEGKAYADRLEAAGVAVCYTQYDNTIHGFMQMGRIIPCAKDAINKVGDYLAEALS